MRHLLYDGWLPLLTSILVRHGMGATRRSVGGVPAEAQAKLEAVLQELLECLRRFRLFVMETDPQQLCASGVSEFCEGASKFSRS